MGIRIPATLVGILSVVAICGSPRCVAAGDTVVTTTVTRSRAVPDIAPSSSTMVVESPRSPAEPDQPVTLYMDDRGGRNEVTKVVMGRPGSAEQRPEPGIKMESENGVPYVTGGNGLDERDQLESLAHGDDLKLIFAENRSEAPHSPLVSDVSVRIRDQAGREVLGVNDAGPWFFARVPSGTYHVEATARGRTLTQTAKIVEGRRTQLAFYW